MALQTASPPAAQVVGNAFVDQYYHILHHSPELVFRFYQDSSVLSRPDSSGVMTSVTTMEGINEKILSLDFKNYKAEIKTADAQNSHTGGVTVLVTGCLTEKDNLRRKFAQSFFLAPQDNGYFVLNDVFRYIDNDEVLEKKHTVNNVDGAPAVPSFPDPEPTRVPDPPARYPAISDLEEDQNVSENVHKPSVRERQVVNEKEAVEESQYHAAENGVLAMAESASSIQEDAPKKSYASIVKVAKTTKVYVPTNTAKVAPKKTENQSLRSAPSAQISNNTPESSNAYHRVEGHSIYIRNLPFNITAAELEAEFNNFGPIKQGATQIRHNKDYCFGFVEFQSLSSMDKAIQASPVTVGGLEAVIEKKRNNRGSSGRGRYPSERERFRNDNFRGRGNYGGGRGYGRNEYSWVEYTGQGRGSSGRGEGYQRGRGRGRGGRSVGPKQQNTIVNA